jgi:hypothetical protein
VRYSAPNFSCEFEISDDWLIESGIKNFAPSAEAYDSTPEAVLVSLAEVIPPMRKQKLPKRLARLRAWEIACSLAANCCRTAHRPGPLVQLPDPDHLLPVPYRYFVRDGFHRFHASIIAGFTFLPASIDTLAAVLQQSQSLGLQS